MKPSRYLKITIPIAIGIFFIFAFIQFIPTGYVGVDESGQVISRRVCLHKPFKAFDIYPVEESEIALKAHVVTPQGDIDFRVAVTVSVDPDHILRLHNAYAGNYVDLLIAPLVEDFLRRKWAGEATEELAGSMAKQLAPSLAVYGVNLFGARIESVKRQTGAEDAAIAARARKYGGKVIIIGSDAFDWEIFRQVSSKRKLPNIEKMIREGASGTLLSVEPLISPMIWTTMATGVEPQVHGIVDFVVHDRATGEDIPITSDMRRVPALWNIATRFGLSSGFVGWLGSYPAEPVTGFVVSDRIVYHVFDPRWQKGEVTDETQNAEGLVYPPELLNDLKSLVRGPEDILYEELAAYVHIAPSEAITEGKTFDRLDPIRNLKLVIAANTTYERIAVAAYEKFHPRVMGVYLDMVDTMCHLFIKHMPPHTPDVSEEEARKFGDAVAAAYAHTDSVIGEWLKIMDDSTTLILISDHGFKSGAIRPKGPSAIGAGQPVKWHRLAGSIALYGYHIKPGVKLTDASVFDVCPTVLRLLGLPPAEDMPGRVLEEAMDQEWLKESSEIGTVKSYGTRGSHGKATRRKEEEEAILDRLKALGYVGRGSTGLKRIASGHFARGEFDKAIEVWKEVLKEEPENVEIMTAIANALIHKGEADEAIPLLKKAISTKPDFLDAHNMLAIAYINLNRLDDAAKVSEGVLARDPRNAEAHFNLGVLYDKLGRYDLALGSFKRSVELRPDYDESRINLANEYLRRGSYLKAKKQLEVAVELNPASAQALYLLGKAELGLGDVSAARERFEECLRQNPGFNAARISISVLKAKEGDLEGALETLKRGTSYPSDLHMVYTNIGVVEYKLGRKDEAERSYKKAIESDPSYLAPRFHLAQLYIEQNKKELASEQLESILKIDPANDQARKMLSRLE